MDINDMFQAVKGMWALPTEKNCQQAWLMFIYKGIQQQLNSKLLVCAAHFTTDRF